MFNMTPFKFMSPLEIVFPSYNEYYYILGMGNKRGVRKRGKCEPKDHIQRRRNQQVKSCIVSLQHRKPKFL